MRRAARTSSCCRPTATLRAPLAELLAADGDVVAVPRLAGRLPDDGERPGWRDLLTAGELDDELVLVRAGARGRAIVDWWAARALERVQASIPAAAPAPPPTRCPGRRSTRPSAR